MTSLYETVIFKRIIWKTCEVDMILYIENPKDATQKTTRTEKWIQQGRRFIEIIAFLYTLSE